jgi:hypothetical protein
MWRRPGSGSSTDAHDRGGGGQHASPSQQRGPSARSASAQDLAALQEQGDSDEVGHHRTITTISHACARPVGVLDPARRPRQREMTWGRRRLQKEQEKAAFESLYQRIRRKIPTRLTMRHVLIWFVLKFLFLAAFTATAQVLLLLNQRTQGATAPSPIHIHFPPAHSVLVAPSCKILETLKPWSCRMG